MPAPKSHPNLTRAGQGRPSLPDDKKAQRIQVTLDPEVLQQLDKTAATKKKFNRSYLMGQCLRAITGIPSDLSLEKLIEIFRK